MKSVKNKLITLYSAAAWHDNLQLTVAGYNSNVVIITNTFTLQVFNIHWIFRIRYN